MSRRPDSLFGTTPTRQGAEENLITRPESLVAVSSRRGLAVLSVHSAPSNFVRTVEPHGGKSGGTKLPRVKTAAS